MKPRRPAFIGSGTHRDPHPGSVNTSSAAEAREWGGGGAPYQRPSAQLIQAVLPNVATVDRDFLADLSPCYCYKSGHPTLGAAVNFHDLVSAAKRRSTVPASLVSHSQITRTRQPSSLSAASWRASRATLAANFSVQKAIRDFGVVAYRHPACRCQKQPWTNTTRRCFGSTTSGRPGRSFGCRRNRSPIRWAMRRTVSSGAVSRVRMAAISSLRRLLSTMSVMR